MLQLKHIKAFGILVWFLTFSAPLFAAPKPAAIVEADKLFDEQQWQAAERT